MNLGSPEAPTPSAVRRYLGEFLWDHRVVDLPRVLWWLILHCFVLTFRPRKSARAYQSIWQKKGSPLTYLTRQLTENVALAKQNDAIVVDWAMRYGKPSISQKLQELKAHKVDEILIIPLYPQYSSTTTASVYDAVNAEIQGWKHIPGLRFISDYYRHPLYIEALAQSVERAWAAEPKKQLLLLSFHGVPAKLVKQGDPYYYHCLETGEALVKRLGLAENEWKLVFQSRFGKAEWLKPYCVEVLQDLPKQGITDIDVMCPGFAVDCLETLEEIRMENRHEFLEAGGKGYRYIECLNDSEMQVKLMLDLIQNG